MKRKTFAAGLGLAALLAAGPAQAADLDVAVTGVRSDEGAVRVAIHRRLAGAEFPAEESVVAGAFFRAGSGPARLVFAGLPPGDYALAAFHDADGDGELGTNLLGVPVEGYGFSRGAHGAMGPPAFDDAAVTLGADGGAVSVVVPIGY